MWAIGWDANVPTVGKLSKNRTPIFRNSVFSLCPKASFWPLSSHSRRYMRVAIVPPHLGSGAKTGVEVWTCSPNRSGFLIWSATVLYNGESEPGWVLWGKWRWGGVILWSEHATWPQPHSISKHISAPTSADGIPIIVATRPSAGIIPSVCFVRFVDIILFGYLIDMISVLLGC